MATYEVHSVTPVTDAARNAAIGKRSDPFFADAEGVLHWLAAGQAGVFEWTGADVFGAANIFSIALEVPNAMLGPGPVIGAWISLSVRKDGALTGYAWGVERRRTLLGREAPQS